MTTFQFGPFALNVERYELSEAGSTLALPRVAMELLILLLRRREGVLSRQEIAAAIWPHSDPDDVTQSINTAINRIRSTLRDDPARPTYVQTVIGLGYRFIARIEEDQSKGADPQLADEAPSPLAAPISLEKLHAWYVSAAPIELSLLRVDAHTSVLALRGALRLGAGLKVADMQLQAEIQKGVTSLVLDLSAVPSIDSAGLGLLIHAFGLMQERGGTLRICAVTERVMSLFRMTKTDGYLAIDADVSASLSAVAAKRHGEET